METLKRQVRDSGSRGFCAGEIDIRNHLNTDCAFGGPDFFNPDRSVVGWEFDSTGRGDDYTLNSLEPAAAGSWTSTTSTGTTGLPSALAGRAIAGSDVLVLRRAVAIPALTALDNVNNPNQASINLNGQHGLQDDAIVLVTDCATGADLFQNRSNANATAFSAGSGSCANPGPGNVNGLNWSTSYGESMQVLTIQLVAYYVGIDGNTGEPGLYRLNMSNGTSGPRVEELVRGIENMQLLYGFSRAAPQGDGQSIRPGDWLRADQVPVTTNSDGWAQVIAIQMGLSVRSPEAADFDQTDITFDLGGANVTIPGDRRIRQPFSTTIALRNRMLVTPE
ncbi:MAG: PilW family protein [Xanthomonadaceae bacterium]|nr:PilW family protein [Xanthomonadaceae bacterium]